VGHQTCLHLLVPKAEVTGGQQGAVELDLSNFLNHMLIFARLEPHLARFEQHAYLQNQQDELQSKAQTD